jgi:nucleoid DNA-binding protein
MIKADIVKRITKSIDLNDKDALAVVDGIIDSLKDVICENKRLEMRDFGVFQIKQRKQRIGRNPRDKKEYPIPARQVVTFRVGKELKNLDTEFIEQHLQEEE